MESRLSVTEASRNFADCINRARYQGAVFTLLKGGAPVARITPVPPRPSTAIESAIALQKALKGLHLGEEEATSWLHDLEQARGSLQRPGRSWRF
jgi:antitoxin (DNA-binding transcriptional repressor) of toxin-antitoxin stability system